METLEHRGWIINYMNCDNPDNPRDNYDHLWTMIYNHRNIDVWDERMKCYWVSFADDFAMHLKEKWLLVKEVVYLPVYMYQHSWVTIATQPFSCPWDSGQVWYIYVSKKKLREEYWVASIKSTQRLKAIQHLREEVKEFDAYLRWDVRMACIKESEDEDNEWMCDYFDKDDCIDDAKSEIDSIIEHRNKQAQVNKETVMNNLLLKSIQLWS